MQVQRTVREITKVSTVPIVQENTKLRVCAYARVSTEKDTNLQLCYADFSI